MSMTGDTIRTETVIALGGVDFIADLSGALYEPGTRTLVVADCHFEKGSAYHRRGHVVPPLDTHDTLLRLEALIRRYRPHTVISLGDGFHDRAAAERLSSEDAARFVALARHCEWIWVAGNHDPDPQARLPGVSLSELAIAGVMLRHEALAGETRPELSGHFHPKLRVKARGRSIVRPCAVASERKLILPAFGALTGGMDAADPAIIAALQPVRAADALLGVQGRLVQYPIWRASA